MKIFKQLIIILGFTLVGSLISYLFSLIPFNFPSSIIGMILLFVFLLIKVIKVESVNDVASFFVNNMGIFFVPASIMILDRIQVLSENWWKFLIIVMVGFVVSFTMTYYSVKLTLYIQNKIKEKKNTNV